MRKTYAPNGIVIGVLLGMLIGVTTKSTALGVVSAVAISVAAWFIIRKIEQLIEHGVDAAGQAMKNAYQQHKDNKNNAVSTNKKYCTSCGKELDGNTSFCTNCGTKQL